MPAYWKAQQKVASAALASKLASTDCKGLPEKREWVMRHTVQTLQPGVERCRDPERDHETIASNICTAFVTACRGHDIFSNSALYESAIRPGTFPPDKVAYFGVDTPPGGQRNELAPTFPFLACHDSRDMTGQVPHLDGCEPVAD